MGGGRFRGGKTVGWVSFHLNPGISRRLYFLGANQASVTPLAMM